MNIVLEGPDGAGKSTLAGRILERFNKIYAATGYAETGRGKNFHGWRVQHSGGPAKSLEEIDERTRAYLEVDKVVFDRHPVVSNPIYSTIFHKHSGPSLTLSQLFYSTGALFIYCRASNSERHTVKPDDLGKAFVDRIPAEFHRLVYLYDVWAVEHAHLIYRIGDDIERFLSSVEARVW